MWRLAYPKKCKGVKLGKGKCYVTVPLSFPTFPSPSPAIYSSPYYTNAVLGLAILLPKFPSVPFVATSNCSEYDVETQMHPLARTMDMKYFLKRHDRIRGE